MSIVNTTSESFAAVSFTPEEAKQAALDGASKAKAGRDDNGNPVIKDAPEDRPSWLPEKFKTAEDMAKSYKELESKLGKPAAPKEPEADAAPEVAAKDQAEAAVAEAGLNMASLSEEYAKSGALSEDSYKTLEKGGIPKDMVDSYIEGQLAVAELQTEKLLTETVGSRDEYTKIVSWAAQNMDKGDIDTYNDAVKSGDPVKVKLAIKDLKATYESKFGNEPTLATGSRGNTDGDRFDSRAEVVAAMRDKRYKSDSAYRDKVAQKIARSSVL